MAADLTVEDLALEPVRFDDLAMLEDFPDA
jgi:hypothetical protein